jgi:hypothetical protein
LWDSSSHSKDKNFAPESEAKDDKAQGDVTMMTDVSKSLALQDLNVILSFSHIPLDYFKALCA